MIPFTVIGKGVGISGILERGYSFDIGCSVILLFTIDVVDLVLSFLWLWKERLRHQLVNPECFAFAIIINQRDFQVP